MTTQPQHPPRQLRPRTAQRGEPSVRMIARLCNASDAIEGWLKRLEAMPGSRRAPLDPELPPYIARVIKRARRAAARDIAEDWVEIWPREAAVSEVSPALNSADTPRITKRTGIRATMEAISMSGDL